MDLCAHPLPAGPAPPHTPSHQGSPHVCVTPCQTKPCSWLPALPRLLVLPGHYLSPPSTSFPGWWYTPDRLSQPGEVNQALGWGAEATPSEQPSNPVCWLWLRVLQRKPVQQGLVCTARGEDGTASLCIRQSANPPWLPPELGPAGPGSCPRARGEHPPRGSAPRR